jgi:Holliday junction resolvase
MRAKKVDSNQAQLVTQMRQLGMTVQVTSMVGNDFPDLVAGFNGRNYLFEVKDGKKMKSKKKLSAGQQEFFLTWRGTVYKIESIDDVLAIINSKK